jgi:hypothetical protein
MVRLEVLEPIKSVHEDTGSLFPILYGRGSYVLINFRYVSRFVPIIGRQSWCEEYAEVFLTSTGVPLKLSIELEWKVWQGGEIIYPDGATFITHQPPDSYQNVIG